MLDAGCGAGAPTARQLADAGLDVVGIDESERMLELARRRVPAATFLRQDIRNLGPQLGAFDAVVAFFTLLMLGRNEIPTILSAIRARLRGAGLLLLGMVAGDLDRSPIPFLGVRIKLSAYPAAELTDVVHQAGFHVLGVRETDVEVDGRTETQLYLRAAADTAGTVSTIR